MNFWGIKKVSLVDGEGIRTVLFVSGCEHHCKNCQNSYTWNSDDGFIFDNDAEIELFRNLDKQVIDGVTFSGGDPLHIVNRNVILRLCKRFRHRYADRKTIWLYTGYLWEEIKDLPIMQYLDVVVDGKYIDELKDENYKWAGSTNQRVIDVQKSLQSGRAILYEEE